MITNTAEHKIVLWSPMNEISRAYIVIWELFRSVLNWRLSKETNQKSWSSLLRNIMWEIIQPKSILEIDKNIDPISDLSEETIRHDLNKAQCFNGFIVNLGGDLNKQLDPLFVSSLDRSNWMDNLSKLKSKQDTQYKWRATGYNQFQRVKEKHEMVWFTWVLHHKWLRCL